MGQGDPGSQHQGGVTLRRFCFQRRSRPKQIDDGTKYQSDEIQHQAQRRRFSMPRQPDLICDRDKGFISAEIARQYVQEAATTDLAPQGP
jgi:hypothetical protein